MAKSKKCDLVVKGGSKMSGTYCRIRKEPLANVDKRSIRWHPSGPGWVMVACPKGKFRGDICSVGMKAVEILVPAKGRK